MKKFLKYTALCLCIGLFFFLMLPFLEPPAAGADKASVPPAKPQIFTSNPLTAIVKRLSRFFAKNEPRRASARADMKRVSREDAPLLASAQAPEVEPTGIGPDTNAPAAQPTDPDEENARFFLKDKSDDWVLVRQRAPETAQSGMHEISVKDSAYDRYVKQERAARFTPAAAAKKTASVPDSKLAKLFAPVKRLFGFGGTAAKSGGLVADDALASARATGSSDGLDKNRAKQARQLPKAQQADIALNRSRSSVVNNSQATALLWDILDPAYAGKNAADLVADSRYPNPQDEQARQAREQARQEQEERYRAQREAALLAKLSEWAQDRKPQDLLAQTLMCNPTHGTTQENNFCLGTGDDIKELRAQNKQYYNEHVANERLKDIPLPILPVFSVASTTLPHEENEQTKNPELYHQKEFYNFMLASKECQSRACAWTVIEGAPMEEDLSGYHISEILEASGVDMKGIPTQQRDQWIEAYLATQEESSEQDQQKIREYLEQLPFAPQTFDEISKQSRKDKITPFFQGAELAREYVIQTGPNHGPLVTNGQNNTAFAVNSNTIAANAKQIIQAVVDNQNWALAQNDEIAQDAGQLAVQNTVAPAVQAIQEELENELKNFNQNNPLGRTVK